MVGWIGIVEWLQNFNDINSKFQNSINKEINIGKINK